MRKRLLLGVGLLCCLACLALLGALLVRLTRDSVKPGVTVENFRLLHKGMTEEEVESIMGGPGTDMMHVTLRHVTHWDGEDCTVGIWFSEIIFDSGPVGAEEGTLTTKDGLSEELRENPRRGKWFPWLGF